MPIKVLFVTSEAFPLIKTGGLGDVAYGLPCALHAQGADVRVLLPAYREILDKTQHYNLIGRLDIWGAGRSHHLRILQTEHEAFPCPIWLVDCPELFDRPGNPYLHPDGHDWADNAERYSVFSRAAAALSGDTMAINWRPDVVHSHDWQTGLVPALIESLPLRPKTVFTIHNMAYGGHFSQETFKELGLPDHFWSPEGMEFHGGFSMLKAGIVYADEVNTVSPTYAQEICTPHFGYGMDGLLKSRSYKLYGILNGIDKTIWNPKLDPYLEHHFDAKQPQPGKQANKRALLEHFGLEVDDALLAQPVLGAVGRLVEQKGIDMIIDCIPFLITHSTARFVLIGSGDAMIEQALYALAERYPDRVLVYIGYNEGLAHLLEAGSDMFLMPSRFEPCGLNQMYSLAYGTLPVVYHTGGLADTVVNATDENIKANRANGFVFYDANKNALQGTLLWALQHYKNPTQWQALQKRAMTTDFSWDNSAKRYLALYQR